MTNHAWQCFQLRLTAFYDMSSTPITDLLNWESLCGELPESSNYKPKSDIKEESGDYKNGVLYSTYNPGKFDLIYGSKFGIENFKDHPTVGNYEDALDDFSPIANKWLDASNNLSRLAYGAELIIPVATHKEGYEYLNELLHHVEVDTESSDFNYSINRKRTINLVDDKYLINRLSNWSVARQTSRQFSGENEFQHDEVYVVKLNLDINNVPNKENIIKKETLKLMFEKFISMGTEISQNGERK